jgi:hypothetical protein
MCMAKPTPAEMRLMIHDAISEILVSLAVDESTTDSDVMALEEDFNEVTDVILEALGLDVLSVDNEEGTECTAKISMIVEPYDEAN